MIELSYPYMTTGKTIAFIRWARVGKVMSLLFNMLPLCQYVPVFLMMYSAYKLNKQGDNIQP